jgi:hypothetical protein
MTRYLSPRDLRANARQEVESVPQVKRAAWSSHGRHPLVDPASLRQYRRAPVHCRELHRMLPGVPSPSQPREAIIGKIIPKGQFTKDGQWTGRPSQPPEWMDTTDEFYGFRQLVGYPQIRLAVCKDGQWDSTKRYTVPSGFRWASKTEIEVVFAQQREPPKSRYAGIHYSHYAGQGGWDGWHGLEWKGIKRWIFLLNDSLERGCCIHAGDREGGLSTQWSVEWMRDMLPKGKFAGLVCIEIPPEELIQGTGVVLYHKDQAALTGAKRVVAAAKAVTAFHTPHYM